MHRLADVRLLDDHWSRFDVGLLDDHWGGLNVRCPANDRRRLYVRGRPVDGLLGSADDDLQLVISRLLHHRPRRLVVAGVGGGAVRGTVTATATTSVA